jgi:TetR/AcrR family transcriptional repressor of bet genes
MAQTMPEAARLLDVYQCRLRSNLRHDLRPLVGPRAAAVAEALAALIDGVYLRQALVRGKTDRAVAVDTVLGVLATEVSRGAGA